MSPGIEFSPDGSTPDKAREAMLMLQKYFRSRSEPEKLSFIDAIETDGPIADRAYDDKRLCSSTVTTQAAQ
jgi:hypothetical protein